MEVEASRIADKIWYRNLMKKLTAEQQSGNNDKNETKGDNND